MLDSLRSLMKDPPATVSYDPAKALRADFLPNFVGHRVAAQTLHAAVINDLHRGDFVLLRPDSGGGAWTRWQVRAVNDNEIKLSDAAGTQKSASVRDVVLLRP